jgi:hypothetical protein
MESRVSRPYMIPFHSNSIHIPCDGYLTPHLTKVCQVETTDVIAENQHKEIVIIDEIDKMQMKDQEGLLTMMERAAFTSTKVANTKQ